MAGCLSLLLSACGINGIVMKPAIEVEIVNSSQHDLENAEARFGEHACRWGWVVKGVSKSYLSYPYPITLRAELHRDSPAHRVDQIDLSKIYVQGKSGRLTFIVYDDRVEVTYSQDS